MQLNSNILTRLAFTHDLTCNNVDQFTSCRNGLKVVLAPDELSSVVSFVILYKVGSRNEAVGYTGSTHFLEHMMFKDTKNHKTELGNGFDQIFKRLGNVTNANTWLDRTMYFECVPADCLETCIEMEADRMRNLVFSQADHDSEMPVVRNELENGESEPAEMMSNQVFATMFREHPYHHPTIGWRSDVEGMPLSRLKQFHDEFYWPNNATVFIFGNFKPETALKLINKHFGKIKRSPKPIPNVYTIEPKQVGERRFELYAQTELASVSVAFRAPKASHKDCVSFMILDNLLGNASMPNSILYKELIASGIAVNCSSSYMGLKDYGIFSIDATVSPNSNPQAVESAILKLVENLKLTKSQQIDYFNKCGWQSVSTESLKELLVSEDLTRTIKAQTKRAVLMTGDPLNLAQTLAESEGQSSWTDFFRNVEAMNKVTLEQLYDLARTYLTKSNRIVGHLYPMTQLNDEPAPVINIEDTVAELPKPHSKAENMVAGVDYVDDASVNETSTASAMTLSRLGNEADSLPVINQRSE